MKILVLAGGSSSEREVSLESGRCVADALLGNRHDVQTVDPAVVDVTSLNAAEWDVAIPMVHGTGGEDGALQSQLDEIGLTYVGSSAAASELTFDKIRTNSLLHQHGIRVAASRVVHAHETADEHLHAILQLGLPIVTKPPRQGSSVGVSIVQDQSHIASALSDAFRYDDECLVETFIAGREVTVPVIDGRVFPVIEIRPAAGWYDYAAKYQDDRTEYRVEPVDIPADVAETAVKACEVCGVTGIARVDFRIAEDGRAYLLEVNTIPGMTSHSLVPKSAAAVGLSLAEVCELAIRNRLPR